MITRPLQPFVAFDRFEFSLRPEALPASSGPGWQHSRNAVALEAYDDGEQVLRFQACGRLEEITLRAPAVALGCVVIPFHALGGFVQAQDPDAFERAGFLVSPRYGLAFVPGEPDWVTALARHCIPTWQAL